MLSVNVKSDYPPCSQLGRGRREREGERERQREVGWLEERFGGKEGLR